MIWKMATDRVLIQREERATQTQSGIVIPDRVKTAVERGIVIASGPQAVNVLPGDVVFFDPKYAREVEKGVFSVDAQSVFALQREE